MKLLNVIIGGYLQRSRVADRFRRAGCGARLWATLRPDFLHIITTTRDCNYVLAYISAMPYYNYERT